MAVYILSNRKIVRQKGEKEDSFSNDEYSIPNFRIAKCDFDSYKEPTVAAKKKKDDTNRSILNYKLFSEPENRVIRMCWMFFRMKKVLKSLL